MNIENQIVLELNQLRKKNFDLIIWKSFDRINDGVEGKTDIDLYLADGAFHELEKHLFKLGWRKFNSEYWRKFPEVNDFFKIFNNGQKNTLIHFHLHETIRTGDRFLKSLFIPKEFIKDSIINQNSFRTLTFEKESELSIIRSAYKIKTVDYIMSLIRFNKDRLFIYHDETKSLIESKRDVINDDFLFDIYPEYFDYLNSRSIIKTMVHRKKIRSKYKNFKKYSPALIFYIKLVSSKLLINGKYIKKGLLVSFIGVDGTGKSTTSKNIYKQLSSQLRVKVIYLGIPKSIAKFRNKLYKIQKLTITKTEVEKINNFESKENKNNKKVIVDTIFSLTVTFIKLLKHLQIKALLSLGFIVVTDRYPLNNIIDYNPQYKNSIFYKFQNKLNNIFREPDKFILLTLTSEELDSRNIELNKNLLEENKIVQKKLTEFANNNDCLILNNNSKNFLNNEYKIINYIFGVNNDS